MQPPARGYVPKRITVEVLCPGIGTPEQLTTCVRSRRAKTRSISFFPCFRFMKLLSTISPTKPATWSCVPDCARSKKRSVKGSPRT